MRASKNTRCYKPSCFYSALLMSKMPLRLDEHSCWTSKAKFSQHWKCCWNSPCVCACVCACVCVRACVRVRVCVRAHARMLFEGCFYEFSLCCLRWGPLMFGLLCLPSLSVLYTHWPAHSGAWLCLVVPRLQLRSVCVYFVVCALGVVLSV